MSVHIPVLIAAHALSKARPFIDAAVRIYQGSRVQKNIAITQKAAGYVGTPVAAGLIAYDGADKLINAAQNDQIRDAENTAAIQAAGKLKNTDNRTGFHVWDGVWGGLSGKPRAPGQTDAYYSKEQQWRDLAASLHTPLEYAVTLGFGAVLPTVLPKGFGVVDAAFHSRGLVQAENKVRALALENAQMNGTFWKAAGMDPLSFALGSNNRTPIRHDLNAAIDQLSTSLGQQLQSPGWEARATRMTFDAGNRILNGQASGNDVQIFNTGIDLFRSDRSLSDAMRHADNLRSGHGLRRDRLPRVPTAGNGE